MTKRVLLSLAYDGTAYHGWQVQPNGITVQEALQDALETMLSVRPAVTGCSRTDAGVHARQFCCHLDCDAAIPERAFLTGLNSLLPNDIAVTACRTVPDGFHARYAAKGKRYRYSWYVGLPDPFASRYAVRLEKKPDTERMNAFAKTVLGRHDFIGFSASGRTVEDTVRTVSLCRVEEDGNRLSFVIAADGFLYNMVRILAGTALEVGQGKRPPDCAETVFQTGSRQAAGQTLPPQGLVLEEVFYDD